MKLQGYTIKEQEEQCHRIRQQIYRYTGYIAAYASVNKSLIATILVCAL